MTRPSGEWRMSEPLSVVELEDLLGPHLHAAASGEAEPLLLERRYVIERIVGKGARGLVCKGRDGRLKRDVAIKLYPAEAALIREVEAEAEALARLDHPNIIGVYDAVQADFQVGGRAVSCLLLAMEFVAGTNVRVWLKRSQPHPREIVALFLAAGEGLAAAHAAATVHRDIKPENIMVDAQGVPRVVDFGLARPAPHVRAAPAGTTGRHTQFGAVLGTLEYMAPEARRGQANERSDQFSLAVALWEALAGVLPFDPHRGEWLLASDEDIVHGLHPAPGERAPKQPKPEGKRVWASVEHDAATVIAQAFQEAEKRDPERRKRWVVLLDGASHQRDCVQRCIRKAAPPHRRRSRRSSTQASAGFAALAPAFLPLGSPFLGGLARRRPQVLTSHRDALGMNGVANNKHTPGGERPSAQPPELPIDRGLAGPGMRRS